MHEHYPVKKEHLNVSLINKQKLSDDDLEDIVDLHRELHHVFDEMVNESDTERLRNLALVVKQLEFDLQEAWGFERNADHHSWWFRVPQCTCPKMDNMDRVGTPYRVIAPSCPIHGDK